jgi:4-amino-4-deoxy-L-arabinose transferase-like glycosyltransferase
LQRPSFIWLWVSIPLLLITTWLGARGLNSDPYWLDEVWSVYNAGGAHTGPLSPAELWIRNAFENPRNAVGYHFLLAGWGALVGWTPFATRASSLLYGVIAVAWTYRLGRDLATPMAGLAAAVFVGTSAFFVYYLHELRTYSLSVLLTVVVVCTYWRIISSRTPSSWFYGGFLLAVVGILYTYYLAGVIVGTLALYHLLFVPKTRKWWAVPALVGIAGVLFLPWLGAMLAGLELATGDELLHAQSLSAGELIGNLAYYFSNGVILLVAILMVSALRKGARTAWFFVLVSVALVIVVNSRLQVIAAGRERYVLMLWPLIAVVCGVGLDKLWKFPGRTTAIPFLGVWALIGIYTSLGSDFTRDIPGAQPLPWDAVANVLAVEASAEDAIIVHSPVGNWVWEITTSDYYLHDVPARFTLLESLSGATAAELRESEREFVAGASQVWVGLDKRVPPAAVFAELEQTLSEGFVSCGIVLDLPRMSLSQYIRRPIGLTPDSAVMRFGDGVTLAYNSPLPEQASRSLDMSLIWAVSPTVPPYTYSVALHVVDAKDHLVGQQDYGLPVETLACRKSTIALSDLPAGEYTLMAAVYRWETGERLSGILATTGQQGDRLPIGTFTIVG